MILMAAWKYEIYFGDCRLKPLKRRIKGRLNIPAHCTGHRLFITGCDIMMKNMKKRINENLCLMLAFILFFISIIYSAPKTKSDIEMVIQKGYYKNYYRASLKTLIYNTIFYLNVKNIFLLNWSLVLFFSSIFFTVEATKDAIQPAFIHQNNAVCMF